MDRKTSDLFKFDKVAADITSQFQPLEISSE